MKAWLMLILTLLPLQMKGQDVRFQHINVDNGLSQNSITSMIQDSQGFIWFGTEYGLNKYDGNKVEIFVPEGGKKGSITGNAIWSILEDSKGRIWVGTNEGVNIFDKDLYSFRKPDIETEEGQKIEGTVGYIFEGEDGDIWFGTFTKGLYRLNERQNKLTHYAIAQVDPRESAMSFRIWSIYIDKNKILWAATWSKGLLRLNTKNGAFEYLNNANSDLKSNYVGTLVAGSDSTLWLGTGNGLQVLNVFTNEISQTINEELNNLNIIQDILRDDRGRLWVATYGEGLFVYDRDLNPLNHFYYEEGNPYSISNNLVLDLMQDTSGCVWAGTWMGGVNKYCPDTIKFNCCQQQYGIKNVFAIEGEDQYILLGTYGNGVYLLDEKKEEIVPIQDNSGRSKDLRYNLVLTISKGRDAEYWIGYQGAGFSRFDLHSREFEYFTAGDGSPGRLNYDTVQKIWAGDDNRIWVGTSGGGLNLFNPQDHTFRYFTTRSTPSISSNVISALLEDSHGNIWIGTQGGGLNALDPSLKRVTEYSSNTDSVNSLSNDHIWDIWEDENGIIWVATSLGLNALNPETGEVKQYTEKEGLGNNWVYNILGDDKGRLWLSTNGGVTVFNVAENRFKNFDVQDGLQSNEFNANAKYKSRDGKMFFGGINGFNAFYPENISTNTNEPKIVFTGLEILNQPVSIGEKKQRVYTIPKHISQLKELVLTHEEQVISLEFAALHFVNPQKNRYRYKLEGFDKNWIEANKRHYVTYTNLDPGSYKFRVNGSNSDGYWSSQEATISITVLPPPWKTWWAYSLYVLMVFGIMFVVTRVIIVRKQLKNDLKIEHIELQKAQELDQAKSHFFAGISHEFRTPLTLISAPVRELIKKYGNDEKTRNNLQLVERNAGQLLNLINQLLDLSKLEAGKLELNVSKEDINKFLKIIAASFHSLAESKGITFIHNISDEACIIYFDREKIEHIVTNLLSNAFKFISSNGQVEFEVISTGKNLQICVRDNGRGIPQNELEHIFDRFYQVPYSDSRFSGGSGIGLALVRELAELHHGSISVESAEGGHTTFIVTIPVSESVYEQEEINLKKPLVVNTAQPVGTKKAEAIGEDHNEDNTDKPIVLVVEDNEDLREYICSSLSASYAVEKAKNGFEGLKKSALIPDLIISDLMMPEMDGLEMLQHLKNDPKTNHIPLIMLTAKADKDSRLKGLDTGADHYINKPFDMEELQVRVNSLMTQRERIRDHYYKEFISNPDAGNILSADNQFLQKSMSVLEQNMGDFSFTVDQFAGKLAMSRVQMHRKLKAVIGCSATEFIREVRLKKAYQYLKERKGTVSEIAYEVGFNNLSYFTKCFKETYDMNPSELLA